MSNPPARDRRQVTTLRVLRTERITPRMIRVVAGGPGLADFQGNDYTDAYVKILFPLEGVAYPSPLDMQAVRRDMPREQWPVIRTYTVRYHDRVAGELAIDFVHHGPSGVAGPWAASVTPGTEFSLNGPGGAYAPDADFPAGDVQAFVHGEAIMVKELRRLLRDERGVPKDRLSISGYWRRGLSEDGYREVKAELNAD